MEVRLFLLLNSNIFYMSAVKRSLEAVTLFIQRVKTVVGYFLIIQYMF